MIIPNICHQALHQLIQKNIALSIERNTLKCLVIHLDILTKNHQTKKLRLASHQNFHLILIMHHSQQLHHQHNRIYNLIRFQQPNKNLNDNLLLLPHTLEVNILFSAHQINNNHQPWPLSMYQEMLTYVQKLQIRKDIYHHHHLIPTLLHLLIQIILQHLQRETTQISVHFLLIRQRFHQNHQNLHYQHHPSRLHQSYHQKLLNLHLLLHQFTQENLAMLARKNLLDQRKRRRYIYLHRLLLATNEALPFQNLLMKVTLLCLH
ncbi:hypothetical protein M9Y10_037435 [Tritrichomonas musculus]|uniref:Uncharacterized protein n=1 Tax=Tritrichomonas musculus TaxID=1915356 RepID=A0ABR2GSI6_9EUKA